MKILNNKNWWDQIRDGWWEWKGEWVILEVEEE